MLITQFAILEMYFDTFLLHLIWIWQLTVDELCLFYVCCILQCARNTIQNKIFSSDRDLLGVVFFATVNLNF
jgi:Ku70/Ku80 N-terminal alpha/beta domain